MSPTFSAKASPRAQARLGARLYRHQHAGAAITAVEWRRIWQAYQAHKATFAA